jgi:obg-like ATPase 1
MNTTIPQVSYDDFVAAGSLGVAREKGLVKIFALLHLTFSDLKHAVKNIFFSVLLSFNLALWLQLRLEGKDYVVQEGDVMLFRFNVWQQ